MRYVVDIETTSECDLTSCGAWVYAEHPTTRILCVAWCDADSDSSPESWDVRQPVEAWAEARDKLLAASKLIAHNAQFERLCLSRIDSPSWDEAGRWLDSALLSAACGRPRKLRDACRALCLPDELSKDARGERLLRLFCAKTPKGRLYSPDEKPEDFEALVAYCRQDVVAERALWRTLEGREDKYLWRQWEVDCAVEDCGVPIDADEARGALALYTQLQHEAEARCSELTGGLPLRSTLALRKWTAEHGWPLNSFASDAVDAALDDEMMCDAHPEVAEFLRLRKAAAGTAGKKYEAIMSMLADDGRCHGILVGRGAHTGRYAGRGLQPQNLPRGKLDKAILPLVRDLVKGGGTLADLEFVANPNDALSSILRDCIAAPKGHRLVVSDYSAIEARVLAWLAGEEWVSAIFAGDGKIYERTAAEMYGKSAESITKHERMAGKIATLALGYGGGVGALNRMSQAYGVVLDDPDGVVTAWRKTRPKTVALWRGLEDAFRKSLSTRSEARVGWNIVFRFEQIAGRDVVTCVLPSGRRIFYWSPRIVQANYREEIAVEVGVGKKIGDAEADGAYLTRIYGGILCENIVQAVAFDILLNALEGLHAAGKRIAFHVHDEIVVIEKAENAEETARFMAETMTRLPAWGDGLVLATEPEIMERYRK